MGKSAAGKKKAEENGNGNGHQEGGFRPQMADPAKLPSLIEEYKKAQMYYPEPSEAEMRLKTGLEVIDDMLWGGVRVGSYVHLWGDPGSGKSYLATCLMRAAQQQWGAWVALLDFEHSFDYDRARTLGVDTDRIYVERPGSAEGGYNRLGKFLVDKAFGVIVVDSTTMMLPEKYLKGEEDNQPATQAKIHSWAFKKITPLLGEGIVVFISQVRQQIGSKAADVRFAPGGKAIQHNAHYDLQIQTATEKSEEEEGYSGYEGKVVSNRKVKKGHTMQTRCLKSRYGADLGKWVDLPFSYELGGVVPKVDDVKVFLMSQGLIRTTGGSGWFEVEGVERKLNGGRALEKYLRDKENRGHVEKLVARGREISAQRKREAREGATEW